MSNFIYGPPPPPPKPAGFSPSALLPNRGTRQTRGRGRGRAPGNSGRANTSRIGFTDHPNRGEFFQNPRYNTDRVDGPDHANSESPIVLKVATPARNEDELPITSHNLFGLVPKLEELSEESDIDEEAAAAAQTQSGAEGTFSKIVFSYRGKSVDLSSPEAVSQWLSERRRNYPTQAKGEEIAKKRADQVEERKRQIEERKQRQAEEAAAMREQKKRKHEQIPSALDSLGNSPKAGALPALGKERSNGLAAHSEALRRKSLHQRMVDSETDQQNIHIVEIIRRLGDSGHL
jgi:hypothetical protein